MDESCRNNHKKRILDLEKIEDTADRLSSLPDFLLIDILNLLPIKSAVATSVLSRRWCSIWTHLTRLRFHSLCFLPPKNSHIELFQYFFTTVDHIFKQLKSSKIFSFSLKFSDNLSTDGWKICTSSVGSWIQQVCCRNVEEIEVCVDGCHCSDTLYLPSCLFNHQGLVKLKLTGSKIVYSLPRNQIISLPNLKELEMSLDDSARELMRVLFKSCPLLECLALELYMKEDEHVVDISAPNLKSLIIAIEPMYAFGASNSNEIVIDAPKLEHIKIHGALVVYHFVSIPNFLFEAEIKLLHSPAHQEEHNYLSRMVRLVQGISCVRSLLLLEDTVPLFRSLHCAHNDVLPLFHDLVHLCMTYTFESDMEQGALLPDCLLSMVKRIEIRELPGTDEDIKLLKYIMSNAPHLEHLLVSVSSSICWSPCDECEMDFSRKEYEYCKTLFMLSKSFLRCQIDFSGTYISAFSSGFRNITCMSS